MLLLLLRLLLRIILMILSLFWLVPSFLVLPLILNLDLIRDADLFPPKTFLSLFLIFLGLFLWTNGFASSLFLLRRFPMVTFYTRNNFPPASHHLPAPDEVPDYQLFYDADRVPFVEKVGTHSRSDAINAYLESTDINKVIERCLLTGDMSPLMAQTSPGYGDLTQMPRSRLDAKRLHDAVIRLYDQSDRSLSLDDFVSQLGRPVQIDTDQTSDLIGDTAQKEVIDNGSVSK
ncbi:internal scaffolding protein [Microvirus mar33]|uniref:Internal scaffolding protein n=1 Tax=Microvirus mar33 TaxID=2851167 RepID=A0A8F5RC11_9VIRU|nr:internal scaffolding protein [Microvirus mar33]